MTTRQIIAQAAADVASTNYGIATVALVARRVDFSRSTIAKHLNAMAADGEVERRLTYRWESQGGSAQSMFGGAGVRKVKYNEYRYRKHGQL